MKSAFESKAAGRVSAWVLVKGGKMAGRLISSRSRSGMNTTTLTLYVIDGVQEFNIATERGRYCPESTLLALILKGWGHPAAALQAERGNVQQAFGLLGLKCWGVL